MSGYFVDVDGRVLPGSVRHSATYAARAEGEDWHPLTLDMAARLLDAEAAAARGAGGGLAGDRAGTAPAGPVRAAGAGQADAAPAGHPRVGLVRRREHLAGAAGVDGHRPARERVPPQRPAAAAACNVDDTFTDDLAAQLVVRDAAGKTVYQRSGALGLAAAEEAAPGRDAGWRLDLPALPAGWYEAALVMSSGAQVPGVAVAGPGATGGRSAAGQAGRAVRVYRHRPAVRRVGGVAARSCRCCRRDG